MKQFLIHILLFLGILSSNAQHPEYYQLTEKDGLPDYEFYDMMIDSKGFIWFAANNGLYRYDGQKFKTYTNPQKRGLSVFGLLEDEEGTIWCNNLGGQIFHIENDSLKIFSDLKNFSDASRLQEFRKYNDYIYVTSDHGLVRINQKTRIPSLLRSQPKDATYFLTNYPRIVGDKIMYVEKHEISKELLFNPDTSKVSELHFGLSNISNIFCTPNYTFIDGTRSLVTTELYVIKNLLEPPIKINNVPSYLATTRTVHLFEDIEGYLWLSTNKGAIRFLLIDNRMTNIQTFFTDKFVTRVQQDKKGVFWFSTLEDGVFIVPNLTINRYDTKNSWLKDTNIVALTHDASDNLFFASKSNVMGKYDLKANKFSFRKRNKVKVSNINTITYENEYDLVVALSDRVNLWKNNEVKKINLANWKDYKILPNNKILFSTTKESGYLENIFDKLSEFSNFSYDFIKDSLDSYTALRKKRSYVNHYNGKFRKSYVSYIDGLYMYNDIFEETIVTYEDNPVFATDIAETDDGIVWASTFNYGLLGLENDKIVERFGEDTILASNTIKSIETDGLNIWVATNKGIQYIKRDTGTDENIEVITIDKNDGLSTNEILDMEVLNDQLFLATKKGLIGIDKTKTYTNNIAPDIYINAVSINEKDTIIASAYRISYQNNLEINFNSNSFNSPNTDKTYRYRLKGLQEKWNQKSTSVARYSMIPPGDYKFEVKAVNEDGVESTKAATIELVITPPYWETWWFYILMAVGLIGVILLIFNIRIRRIRQQNVLRKQKREVELELISSKLVALRSQMNPHFLFNALNSIQEYILTNQKDLASDYLGKFADLMRIYLDHSRKNEVTIEEEIRALRLYLDLEKNRFEDSLEYKIIVTEEEHFSTQYKIPSLLIQPYVENAIKHGLLHKKNYRILKVSFSSCTEQENVIICEIYDNGIGRARSAEINKNRPKGHQSFASDAGKTRLELLNQENQKAIGVDILDLKKDDIALGTKVILRIPFF